MKIKEILKDCTINSPNVFIYLRNNIDIELFGENDFSNLIDTYGNSLVHDWSICNLDGNTYVFFNVKKLVKGK